MIKILHISDLHLVSDASGDGMMDVLLREVEEEFKSIPLGQKLLIVSGDFHNFNEKNYTKAAEFLRTLAKDKMGIEMGQDVFVVPGNHDVANPELLRKLKPQNILDLFQDDIIRHLEDEKPEPERARYLELRRRAFEPYCKFVKELGIYEAKASDLPARVHVRCWRGQLNLLHLNTALVSDKNQGKKQMADIDEALRSETWKDVDSERPTLALGHHHFFDLIEEAGKKHLMHRSALKGTFDQHNISAYLCGDRHKRDYDEDRMNIHLGSQEDPRHRVIPVICSLKGADDNTDDYSDIGYCIHCWDTSTNQVTVCFHKREAPHARDTTPSSKTRSYQMFVPHAKDPDSDPGKAALKSCLTRLEEGSKKGAAQDREEYDQINKALEYLETKRDCLIKTMVELHQELVKKAGKSDAFCMTWLRSTEVGSDGQPVMPLLYAELKLRMAACKLEMKGTSSYAIRESLEQAKQCLEEHQAFVPSHSMGNREAEAIRGLLERHGELLDRLKRER